MSPTDAALEERIRPASNALTAALPALRCNANNPGPDPGPRMRPSLALRVTSVWAVSRWAAESATLRESPIARAWRSVLRWSTASHVTLRADLRARKGSVGNRNAQVGLSYSESAAPVPSQLGRLRAREEHRPEQADTPPSNNRGPLIAAAEMLPLTSAFIVPVIVDRLKHAVGLEAWSGSWNEFVPRAIHGSDAEVIRRGTKEFVG
jgi:hypothetical protein